MIHGNGFLVLVEIEPIPDAFSMKYQSLVRNSVQFALKGGIIIVALQIEPPRRAPYRLDIIEIHAPPKVIFPRHSR